MQQPLLTLPEVYEEGVWEDAIQHVDDEDAVPVAGDVPEDVILEEDEAVAIFANYGQVRQYLHERKLGRGFFRQQPPSKGKSKSKVKQKGKRRGYAARPKRWTKSKLMSRSRCARCGQI